MRWSLPKAFKKLCIAMSSEARLFTVFWSKLPWKGVLLFYITYRETEKKSPTLRHCPAHYHLFDTIVNLQIARQLSTQYYKLIISIYSRIILIYVSRMCAKENGGCSESFHFFSFISLYSNLFRLITALKWNPGDFYVLIRGVTRFVKKLSHFSS